MQIVFSIRLSCPYFVALYIQLCEVISIYYMIHARRIQLRKIDDTHDILVELHKVNGNINFTIQEEVNKSISFLDCLISRTNENQLRTPSYKKNRNTGQYSNFCSNQSLSVQLSTILALTKKLKLYVLTRLDLIKNQIA